MNEPPRYEAPALVAEPLSVDVVEGEVILAGGVAVGVSLTPQAALRTGLALIEAASRMVVYPAPEPADSGA